MMRRAWVLGLLVAACAGIATTTEETSTTETPTTTVVKATTTAQVTTTTVRQTTTTTDSCVAYRAKITEPATTIIEGLNATTFVFQSMGDESITLDEGADQLFVLGDRLQRAAEDIRSLGDPPEEMKSGIEIMLRGLDIFAGALEDASTSARLVDLSALREVSAALQNSEALILEGADLITC